MTQRFCDRSPEGPAAFPALTAALALCRQSGAALLVARLDRIPFEHFGHAVFFADPGLRLCVAGLPDARKSELQIHARMTERERVFDRDRLRADLPPATRNPAIQNPQTPADESDAAPAGGQSVLHADVLPVALPMRKSGSTLREIASALNRRGWTTETGTAWRPTHVSRLLRDLG